MVADSMNHVYKVQKLTGLYSPDGCRLFWVTVADNLEYEYMCQALRRVYQKYARKDAARRLYCVIEYAGDGYARDVAFLNTPWHPRTGWLAGGTDQPTMGYYQL